uniref:Secreted protein n=1 Tax=Ascaris lumbricoides TaxID=6252 RepID=A0A0M3IPC3_ASCLU
MVTETPATTALSVAIILRIVTEAVKAVMTGSETIDSTESPRKCRYYKHITVDCVKCPTLLPGRMVIGHGSCNDSEMKHRKSRKEQFDVIAGNRARIGENPSQFWRIAGRENRVEYWWHRWPTIGRCGGVFSMNLRHVPQKRQSIKDRVAHAYYNYGRLCSAHPGACLSISIITIVLLSYPAAIRFKLPASSPMDVHWNEKHFVEKGCSICFSFG